MNEPKRQWSLREQVGDDPAYSQPTRETYLNLVRTHAALNGEVTQLLQRHGLTEPLYNILRTLLQAGSEGASHGMLGKRMIARDPDITRLVDRLEKKGWAQRQRSSRDRRVVQVVLTDEGRAKIDQVEPIYQELLDRLLGHLSAERLALLDAVLSDLRYPLTAAS
ncbi:MAG: MarR family transcriptional regulator [Acidobacteriota bacterium]